MKQSISPSRLPARQVRIARDWLSDFVNISVLIKSPYFCLWAKKFCKFFCASSKSDDAMQIKSGELNLAGREKKYVAQQQFFLCL